MKSKEYKFGTFSGVFIPSILTIFGPIMFMRFNYVIGEVGIWNTLIILLLSQLTTISTAFSLAAISTNTEVLEGGAYYLISRSLGAGFGGAIGLTLFLAQALSVPFYIIGFTEAFVGTFPVFQILYLYIALLIGILLFYLAWTGANWAIKTQIVIFVILMLSILTFMWGAGTHFSHTTMVQNQSRLGTGSFFVMFAIFFPAVTGIMAGVNMSGNLKKPGFSLAAGTFLAIGFSTIIYAVEIFLCGSAFTREQLINKPYLSLIEHAIFGLGFLVVAGVFAATLSSAIGSYLGAPRVLRALSRDSFLPGLGMFTKENNEHNEPRKALILTSIITISILIWAGLLAGSKTGKDPFNIVAQIVTMFFLYTYGMINLAAFVESFGGNPSFRPRFKYFHWSISLFGTLICVFLSFLIDFKAAALACIFLIILYIVAQKRKMKQNFGDAQRGFIYSRIRNNLIRLTNMPSDPKNWRPTIVVLTGDVENREDSFSLLSFGVYFEGGKGIVTTVEFIVGNFNELKDLRNETIQKFRNFIEENNFISVFPEVIVTDNFDSGLSDFLQSHSIGPLKPNIIMLGCPKHETRKEPFVMHLNMISALDKSFIIFVNSKLPENKCIVPKGKFIDIWWRGHRNGSLMFILAYILQRNPNWDDTIIRIIRLVSDKKETKGAMQELSKMINASRIQAIPKVIVSTNFASSLKEFSQKSAAIFLGTFVPKVEDSDTFIENIELLTNEMPPVFIVNSSGDADFLA